MTGFNADGSAQSSRRSAALPGCPGRRPQPQGFSLLTSNSFNQVEAPPWNVPVCDPTADNGANTCRLANGTDRRRGPAGGARLRRGERRPAGLRDQSRASRTSCSAAVRRTRSRAPTSRTSAAPTSRCAGRRRASSSTTATPTASGTPVTRRSSNWQIKLYQRRRRQGPRGHRRRRDRQRRDRRSRTDDDQRQRGTTSSPTSQNGDYIVCEVKQAGWNQSLPNAGTADQADCTRRPEPSAALGRGFTMAGAGPHRQRLRELPERHEVGHEVRRTRTATASANTGEPGLAGVQIHLFGTDGLGNAVHEHTTTDANGNYSFSVAPGNYTACETVPAGYTQSFPTSGPSCARHTQGASGIGYTVTLTSGGTDSGNDFGNFQNGTKSGTKFEDLNANGVRDATEPGSRASQIHLFGTDGRGNPSTCTRPRTSTARTRSRHRPAATRRARPCRPGTRSRSRPRDRAARGTPERPGSATP